MLNIKRNSALTLGTSTFAFFILLSLASATRAADAADLEKRIPVPTEAAQNKARAVAKELFGAEFAKATTPTTKAELAQKLLTTAGESASQPADAFVLLQIARDISLSAGDAETALKAAGQLVDRYELDLDKSDVSAQIIKKVYEMPRRASTPGELCDLAFTWAKESMGDNDFATAKELLDIAVKSGGKAADRKGTVRDAIAAKAACDELAKEYAEVAKLLPRLEKDPQDPAANLAMGRFLCLSQDNWDEGLPMLAQGSDEKLKKLAHDALMSDTTKPDEVVKMADGWWDLGQTLKGRSKDHALAFARLHYSGVVGSLTGLPQAKVEKRLEIKSESASDAPASTTKTKLATKSKVAADDPEMRAKLAELSKKRRIEMNKRMADKSAAGNRAFWGKFDSARRGAP